jgi:cell division protein FtsB
VLEAEIDKVENDPTQLEGLARTSLGMIREGETVYRFVDTP